MAVPLSIIFVARVCYAYQKYAWGTNLAGQKGDWAWRLATLMGGASIAIVAVSILYRIAVLFGKTRANYVSKKRGRTFISTLMVCIGMPGSAFISRKAIVFARRR